MTCGILFGILLFVTHLHKLNQSYVGKYLIEIKAKTHIEVKPNYTQKCSTFLIYIFGLAQMI